MFTWNPYNPYSPVKINSKGEYTPLKKLEEIIERVRGDLGKLGIHQQNILSILVRLPLGEMCTLAHIGGMRLNPIIKRALLKAVSDAYEGKESTIKPDSLPSSRYSC